MPPKHTWINIRFQMQAMLLFPNQCLRNQDSSFGYDRLLHPHLISLINIKLPLVKIRISYMLFHILSFPYEIPVKIIQ